MPWVEVTSYQVVPNVPGQHFTIPAPSPMIRAQPDVVGSREGKVVSLDIDEDTLIVDDADGRIKQPARDEHRDREQEQAGDSQ